MKSETPQLHRLFSEQRAHREKYRSTVIVIPEFESEISWQDGWGNPWLLTRLPAMISDPCVLSFTPGIRLDHTFSWQIVIERGDLLLKQILLECEADTNFVKRPLIFIAHGLGGLLLKRCISVLYERFFEPKYADLISVTAALVFLSTPSPAPNKPRDLKSVLTLLRAISKHSSSKDTHRWSENLVIAVNISQRFSDIGFDAPILSAFETKMSKVGKSIFSPRQILVDRYLCETMSRRERVVGVESTHEDCPSFSSASCLDEELINFLNVSLGLREISKHSRTSITTKSSDIVKDLVSDISDIRGRMDRTSLHGCWSWDSLPSPALSTYGSSLSDFVHVRPATPLSSHQHNAKLPCYLLGPHERNPDFVGRQDVLTALDQALLPGSKSEVISSQGQLRTFALFGLGGLGKTQIAVEYMYSRKPQYQAIFWVHADDSTKLANDFYHIALALGLESEERLGDLVVARNLVLQFLSYTTTTKDNESTQDLSLASAKWLLIFDNAESLLDLRDYFPVTGSGSVLITSRDPIARSQTYFFSPQGIELQPFSSSESAAWLRRLTRQDETPEDIELSESIVAKVSHLPLAIMQVAGAITRQCLSFAEFTDLYSAQSFREQLYSSEEYGNQQKRIWETFIFHGQSISRSSIPQSFTEA